MSSKDCIESPQKADVLAAQNSLVVSAGLSIAVLVTIHLLPKHVSQPIRLAYTVGYFAALHGLIFQIGGPLKNYLHLLYAWRYDAAPEPMERAWKSMLFSLHQLLSVLSILLTIFIGSIAIMMLALWFPALTVFGFLTDLLWWISLIGLALVPFAGGFLFNEVAQKQRLLAHETQLSRSFTPRKIADLNSVWTDDTPQTPEILDQLKFRAGGFDWEWNDFVQNCVVFGQIGSGKTSCVLNSILDGLLGSAAKAAMRPSGLILDPKGLFLEDVRQLCLRYGRADDLIVLNPYDRNHLCWNPFDSDDDEYELATRFSAVSRSLGMKDANSSFWQTKSTMFMQYAIELIRLTNPQHQPPSFAQINELANSFSAIADRTDLLDVNDPRSNDCLSFFATEWATAAPELRTSVQAHLTGMLFPFLKEPYATRFAGQSTIRISEIIDSGKILYLHMPTADRESMARTIGIFLKLEYYREILKRPRKKVPSFFFCDEFQKFFTAGTKDDKEQSKSDADTFRLSRESFHANIVSTQNTGALGDNEVARAFLGNCMTGIFLRNPDEETNRFTSQLFGEEMIAMRSQSQSAGTGKIKRFGGDMAGSTDAPEPRCSPDRFRELAICSKEQAIPHCESIVFLGGRGGKPVPVRRLKWKRHPLSVDP